MKEETSVSVSQSAATREPISRAATEAAPSGQVYGALPEDLGLVDLSPVEMMFWLYCPIQTPTCGMAIPENLRQFIPLVDAVMWREDGAEGQYVYLTAKTLWVTPSNPGNRPGWHSDGFGSNDVNYIWYDGSATEFIEDRFTLPDDCADAMQRMAERADRLPVVTFPDKHLLRLTPACIHRVPADFPPGLRTFVKVSISPDRYNLAGNSINHGLGERWPLLPRRSERNHPHDTAERYDRTRDEPQSNPSVLRVDREEIESVVDHVLIEPDDLQELIQQAYLAGCRDVQENYRPLREGEDPEFGEASYDYVASLDFTECTKPHRPALSAPPALGWGGEGEGKQEDSSSNASPREPRADALRPSGSEPSGPEDLWSVAAVAYRIADGFSNGNEQYDEANGDQQRRYIEAARSVMAVSEHPAAEWLERAALICEAQARDFLSPEYAQGQPLSSFNERFACDECARAIRAEKLTIGASPEGVPTLALEDPSSLSPTPVRGGSSRAMSGSTASPKSDNHNHSGKEER